VEPHVRSVDAIHDVWDQGIKLLDARGVRSRFMSSFFILVENAYAVLVVTAVARSFWAAMRPFILPGNDALLLERGRCFELFAAKESSWAVAYLRGLDVDRGISRLDYIRHCMPGTNWQKAGFLLQDGAIGFNLDGHTVAINMLLFRLLGILNLWPALHWISLTATVCLKKILHFFVLYMSVVGFFAIGANISFGNYFLQFRSFSDAFYALVLFSSGHTDRALESVQPWIDFQSAAVLWFLLIYTMLVAVVIMNVFTSIVLEAYEIAQDPKDAESAAENHNRMLLCDMVHALRAHRDGYDSPASSPRSVSNGDPENLSVENDTGAVKV